MSSASGTIRFVFVVSVTISLATAAFAEPTLTSEQDLGDDNGGPIVVFNPNFQGPALETGAVIRVWEMGSPWGTTDRPDNYFKNGPPIDVPLRYQAIYYDPDTGCGCTGCPDGEPRPRPWPPHGPWRPDVASANCDASTQPLLGEAITLWSEDAVPLVFSPAVDELRGTEAGLIGNLLQSIHDGSWNTPGLELLKESVQWGSDAAAHGFLKDALMMSPEMHGWVSEGATYAPSEEAPMIHDPSNHCQKCSWSKPGECVGCIGHHWPPSGSCADRV